MEDTRLTPQQRLQYLAEQLSRSNLIPPRHEDLLHAAEEVREIISELSHRADNRGGIVAVVCRHYGIEEKAIRGKGRTRAVAEPRRVAMHMMRKHTNMTLQDIADELCRDHTTVIYGLQTVKDEYQRNPSFARNMDLLDKLVQPAIPQEEKNNG